MIKPPIPPNETTRLETLRSYNILDTPPEPAFEGIAHLAALICHSRVSIVTLVDENRQWFKALRGLQLRETHRDLSFCAHAILEEDVLVVQDATQDARFRENELVTGPPGIRFYAGAPIQVEQGVRVGTVAVIDNQPRNLEQDQIEGLHELSVQAAAQLDLRKTLMDFARAQRSLSDQTMESVPGIFYVFDANGEALRWNRNFERVFGYTSDEIFGMHATDFFPGENHERIRRTIRRILEHGSDQIEADIVTRNGQRIPYLLTGRRIEISGQTRMIGMGVDLTQRKQAERERVNLQAQLQHLQKMESLGRLAAGVAHDFNNVLAAILGHAESALNVSKVSDAAYQPLLTIRDTAIRSGHLTRQLLGFARKQDVQPEIADLNETIGSSMSMLERLIGSNRSLVWRPDPDLWPVKIDPAQVDQIMMNLLVNARDATETGGTITVETENRSFRKDSGEGGLEQCAVIRVSDDGCGIGDSDQQKIFEPFFSTKPPDVGTGLGLSTVYGIVEQNHGLIDVASELQSGTTFTIYFPASEGVPDRTSHLAGSAAISRGNETILLVDDDPDLLQSTEAMLEALGYTVLAASSARDAAELAANQQNVIDLLLTDMFMPDTSGRELAETLAASRGPLKCLIMSGYSTPEDTGNRGDNQTVPFLSKPFGLRQLAAKVRATLES